MASSRRKEILDGQLAEANRHLDGDNDEEGVKTYYEHVAQNLEKCEAQERKLLEDGDTVSAELKAELKQLREHEAVVRKNIEEWVVARKTTRLEVDSPQSS